MARTVYYGTGSAEARWSESWPCENDYPDRKGTTKRFTAELPENDARSTREAAVNAIEAKIRAKAHGDNACWRVGIVYPEIRSKEVD